MELLARGSAASALALLLTLSCASPKHQEPSRPGAGGAARASAPEAAPEQELPPPAEPVELEGPGWLGVELAAREPAEAGVLVRDVTPSSPAEKAGIAAGDVLLSVDGESVQRPDDVVRLVTQRRAGARVSLGFRRGESDRLAAVVLAARPNTDELMQKTYVGSPAPSFKSLATVQGAVPTDISALRGKVVVVEFWASWCVPCRLSAPKLNAWHERWKAEGLEVLGVTTDPAVLATQASVEFGIRYAVASDQSGKTSRAYRAMSIPTLFVIDRRGVVRQVVVGYSTHGLAQVERLVEELVQTP